MTETTTTVFFGTKTSLVDVPLVRVIGRERATVVSWEGLDEEREFSCGKTKEIAGRTYIRGRNTTGGYLKLFSAPSILRVE